MIAKQMTIFLPFRRWLCADHLRRNQLVKCVLLLHAFQLQHAVFLRNAFQVETDEVIT
jgi:hypothetical protein